MKLPIHTNALYIPLDGVRGILIGSVVVLVPLVSLIYQLAGFHSMLGETRVDHTLISCHEIHCQLIHRRTTYLQHTHRTVQYSTIQYNTLCY